MTQHDKLIKYMLEVGPITTVEAYEQLHITQLATRIKELIDLKHPIKKEWTKKRNCKLKAYSYSKEIPNLFGEFTN